MSDSDGKTTYKITLVAEVSDDGPFPTNFTTIELNVTGYRPAAVVHAVQEYLDVIARDGQIKALAESEPAKAKSELHMIKRPVPAFAEPASGHAPGASAAEKVTTFVKDLDDHGDQQ